MTSLLLLLLPACKTQSCLGGEDGCVVDSPCEKVAFTCDDGTAELYQVDADHPAPGGGNALAAYGDYVLGNDQVVAVVDAIDHPHYIAPTGGMLLDLTTRGKDNDALRHMFEATGLLPDEAIRYDKVDLLDDGDIKAVQV